MSENDRVRDHVRFGSDADVQTQLEDLRLVFLRCCDWINANVDRTDRTLVMFNLLAGGVTYLELLVRNPDAPIQLLALCTRSLYELNLRARCILKADAAIVAWQAECAADRIEVIEGLLQLSGTGSTAQRDLLQTEVERIRGLAKKYGLPDKVKLASAIELAKSVGLESEHRAFFKLSSKLVHPSSYLVNSPDLAADSTTRNILLINLQMYALDLLQRLSDALSMPQELLRKPPDC